MTFRSTPSSSTPCPSSYFRIESVRIRSPDGRLLRDTEGRGVRIIQVNLTGLKPGVYLVEVLTDSGKRKTVRTVIR